MITFSPTAFRANSSEVFNAVQANGEVKIKSKSRPDMVLMLKNEWEALQNIVTKLESQIK